MSIIKKIKSTFFTVRYIKFFITGVTAFLVDYSMFTLLTKLSLLSIGPDENVHRLARNTVSIFTSLIVNYLINKFWVWNSKTEAVGLEFGKFVSVQAFNYVMNNVFLFIFANLLINKLIVRVLENFSFVPTQMTTFLSNDDSNDLLAKFFATAIQMITSFLFYKFFVFKQKEK